jgi:choline dehydrogenase-like flavoprotein
MIVEPSALSGEILESADVVIVGAGPAGIVVALEMADRGAKVLLVESGLEGYSEEIQQLGDTTRYDRDLHAPMMMATRRQIGGTSAIWGGRCVPYDRVDFDHRPFIGDAQWPISYEEVLPYHGRACSWMVCGRPVFDATQSARLARPLIPGLPDLEARTTSLERWSLPTDFGREYGRRLRDAQNVWLVTGFTCTKIVCDDRGDAVDHLECRSLSNGSVDIRGRRYVIAAGGLETTRLLLASPGRDGVAIGNHSDHLGRWYMGHLEGVIANAHFTTPPKQTRFGYERDVDGVYVRRRFSFTREFQHERQLPNIVAWLANAELADPAHRRGILSFVYLALISPLGGFFAPDAQRLSLTGERIPGSPYGGAARGPVSMHLKNILREPMNTLHFVLTFGLSRFLARRKMPGFFAYSPENIYPFQYHGEHRPGRDSRVTLSDDVDELDMPKLAIDIRFSDDDVKGVVEAHRCWDEYLRNTGCGRLEYIDEDLESSVRSRAGGGFHQIGTTRMAADPQDGVVDSDLRVHGLENLFLISSSTFVTSSQANSTFMIVALAVRLADHLAHLSEIETEPVEL